MNIQVSASENAFLGSTSNAFCINAIKGMDSYRPGGTLYLVILNCVNGGQDKKLLFEFTEIKC